MSVKEDLWLGSAASMRGAIEAEERAAAAPATAFMQQSTQTKPAAGAEELPRLYSRKDNVGIITIRGALTNSDSFWAELFGMTTYPAIREALVFGAQDGKVSALMLDIESPGGQVSGVNDVAKLVKKVDAMKPVHAFSDSLAASAAYWIASGARQFSVGETAVIGSVGVIATLVSQAGALEKEGIDVRVVRGGKNKALYHPAEPISEAAVKQTQDRVDALYEVFTGTVAANRPELSMAKREEWADGNEFLGEDAVDVGLADSVSTFDEAFAALVQKVDAVKSPNNTRDNQNKRDLMKPRAALNPADIAAIEAGVELEANTEHQETPAPASAEAQSEASAGDGSPQAQPDAEPAAAAEPSGIELLQAQVKDLTAELVAVRTEFTLAVQKLEAADAAKAETEKTLSALAGIATNSINTMHVALGGQRLDLAGLTPAEVVARHSEVYTSFKKSFPVGGVAATAAAPEARKHTAPEATPKHRAMIRAVNLGNRGR